MRISALPTCWSNVLTAFWLGGGADRYDLLGLLILTSSCFYLFGMVSNDVCDEKIDALERPERPIPSGQVSLKAANRLVALSFLSGWFSLSYLPVPSLFDTPILSTCKHHAFLLMLSILGYNAGLKRIPIIGPITMGLCRFFNILMVSFAVGGSWSVYALAVFVYVTAVTILSGYEVKSLFVRKLVGIGRASIILIDAAWCLVYVGPVPALIVLALYPVAMGLRQIVSMT
jgi:4-hydroxybenzoate polyprenyltransferase